MITFPEEDTFPLGGTPQSHSIIDEHFGIPEMKECIDCGGPVLNETRCLFCEEKNR